MKLSVVVGPYDMAPGAAPHAGSFAPSYQRGIEGDDYEVIVVDNGSPAPLAPALLDGSPPSGARSGSTPAPPVSARAANTGIEAGDADFVGLFIDGARIASPGLSALMLQARSFPIGPS